MIQISQVTKTYKEGDTPKTILDSIDYALEPATIYTLVGPSGSGKSTLLHLLSCLDLPDQGEILYEGKNIFTYSEMEKTEFRRQKLGYIFQFFHLIPYLSVLDNVCVPLFIQGVPQKKAMETAKTVLEQVGLSQKFQSTPKELSGGEQQRVAIARAIATNPKILLADEPTGNLDQANTHLVVDLLLRLQEQNKFLLFLVTHNPVVAKIGKVQLQLENGKLVNA